ncbi:uncharacterized protein Eint_071770 [Encephalitozoon intestinalis ATCC 50506]|uniref:Uncharacterized protein n=1 Tax=Encephalitozoon intestinalis (strain ATCC 50506) TaxID=876142 RepID=E0S8A1_ENCIT|nr:uncharacterized protein Eint_071770 [Encephalitozoon intestinalis ATCC 50506]ADM11936.1 hypothetical protein Eint_071770 [Encephalitozoon intestinalis ATCC 50506]UTX45695.1 hypothetical protein GPK93_07g12640 [Encephalitozoon intestinalis]
MENLNDEDIKLKSSLENTFKEIDQFFSDAGIIFSKSEHFNLVKEINATMNSFLGPRKEIYNRNVQTNAKNFLESAKEVAKAFKEVFNSLKKESIESFKEAYKKYNRKVENSKNIYSELEKCLSEYGSHTSSACSGVSSSIPGKETSCKHLKSERANRALSQALSFKKK